MPDPGSFQLVAVSGGLFVEGRTRGMGSEVTEFNGRVLAIGWMTESQGSGEGPQRGLWDQRWFESAAPELHYLVSDLSKPAPIWVAAHELTSQRWARSPGAGVS